MAGDVGSGVDGGSGDGGSGDGVDVDVDDVVHRLRGAGVSVLALTWVDNSGVARVKGVPLSRLASVVAHGVGASPVFDAFAADDTILAGSYAGGPVGDLRLHPDLRRAVALAAAPGWAWAPVDRLRQDGAVHPQDQRSLARRAVAALAGAGWSALAAFEVEWALSAGDGDAFTPAAPGPAYGFARLLERSDYLRDVVDALDRQEVAVEQVHPEYGAGQFEVSVAAEDPLGAADSSVLVRSTIRAVSLRHGLRASFSPRVAVDGVGNGGHLHLSLWREGANGFSGGDGPLGMTPAAAAFTAGVLDHLPALLAVGAPSVASHLRLVPSAWAGAWAAWGLENRETALRLVAGAPGRPGAANLEVKVFDQAANPYLVVAGTLFAGLAGMAAGAQLPEPVDVDPVRLDDAERARRGIRPLPDGLAEATRAFAADDVLTAAFGTELATTLVELRRADVERWAGASAQEVVDAARWRH